MPAAARLFERAPLGTCIFSFSLSRSPSRYRVRPCGRSADGAVFRQIQPEVDSARLGNEPCVIVLRIICTQDQFTVRVSELLQHDLPRHPLRGNSRCPVLPQRMDDEVLLELQLPAHLAKPLFDVVGVALRPTVGPLRR